ncbi:hypothetical protein DFR70_10353 [Nocardia tenerifensis]|uniref:Uncharacterized protein n=1 Tax=Nocardia tenerifensis TaxID=228006 RepID=A0A318K8J6_9NOCA|nr:hypothetical protein [Nocardia tenerifensis]PXX66306.1 hypothetical protein DFR70_10353 [Nocardia tenerifensis]
MTTVSGLPAYSEFVSHPEAAPPRPLKRWPFVLIIAIGALLVLAPIGTGMFPRAVKGEAMIDAFEPYMTRSSIDGYRHDLQVLDDARTNVLTLRQRGQEAGGYARVDQFVRDYPEIGDHMSGMLNAIDDNRGNYEKLAGVPPFGTLPWLFALPGVLLAAAGVLGFLRARAGRGSTVWRSIAGLAALGLLAVPLLGGLFPASPAAQPLIDDLRPILTRDEVRKVQGYFVTLVAADGELNSRYTADVRAAHPDADLTGITTLETRWQPMTSRFAALIGAMNDNVRNFDAVVALNESTRPLGFGAFRGLGFFYAVPGILLLAVTAAGLRSPSRVPARVAASRGTKVLGGERP